MLDASKAVVAISLDRTKQSCRFSAMAKCAEVPIKSEVPWLASTESSCSKASENSIDKNCQDSIEKSGPGAGPSMLVQAVAMEDKNSAHHTWQGHRRQRGLRLRLVNRLPYLTSNVLTNGWSISNSSSVGATFSCKKSHDTASDLQHSHKAAATSDAEVVADVMQALDSWARALERPKC